MRDEMLSLRNQGKWAQGPHDLLSIVGLNRWELAHSAALAWLCTPDAAHGLGSAFLEALVAFTGDPVPMTGIVEARTEVSRAEARADVIVEGPEWALVIEVKVDATEQLRQAQRLFNDWNEDGDVRFIFLTRRGTPPLSVDVGTPSAWTPVSWRAVRSILDSLATETAGSAQPALREYLQTLKSTF